MLGRRGSRSLHTQTLSSGWIYRRTIRTTADLKLWHFPYLQVGFRLLRASSFSLSLSLGIVTFFPLSLAPFRRALYLDSRLAALFSTSLLDCLVSPAFSAAVPFSTASAAFTHSAAFFSMASIARASAVAGSALATCSELLAPTPAKVSRDFARQAE